MTPIRPEQTSLYSGSPSSSPDSESSSPEWLKIRASILKRARDCCEGSVTYPACRVQHGPGPSVHRGEGDPDDHSP